VPYLSALEMSHDKALYKSTDTLLFPGPDHPWGGWGWSLRVQRKFTK